MQGQKSSIPSFNHGSTSSNAAIQPQIPWNGVQNHHSEHIVSTLRRSIDEPSSSAGQGQVSKGAFHPYEPSNSTNGNQIDRLEISINSRDSSVDGPHSSCKRKAVEATHIGPSSSGTSISDLYHLRPSSPRNVRLRTTDASPHEGHIFDGTTLNLAVIGSVCESSSVSRAMDRSLPIPSQEPVNVGTNGGSNGSSSSLAIGESSYGTTANRDTRSYIERLEIARRALLAALGDEAEGQRDGSNSSIIRGSSSSSPHSSSSLYGNTSLDQRNLDGLMSEIRQMLDHMESREGLRFEEATLGRSFIFEMAGLNDRHRDMRMDVDDMSYEELLELGEQIGNVCTGLKEGTISIHLKQRKFAEKKQSEVEREPCSICREEYVEGEDVGGLDCGHDFHTECVKQWLMLKNLCPVCKTTGLNCAADE